MNMKDKAHNLEILSHCGVCRTRFKGTDLALLAEKPLKTVFHATCPKCETAVLIFLSSGPKGLVGMEMMTDLDKDEAKEKLSLKAITTDEVIDAYKSLKL